MNNIPSKSAGEIIRGNTLTFFNALNLCLAAAVLWTGEYRNMLFLGVIVANTLIGIVQELRAKRAIDRLALIHQTTARVIRNGLIIELHISELVPGDVIILDEGRQIPADCEVLEGNIEVNESLLTGESEAIVKQDGDELLSGSFVICGEAHAAVRRTGADSFASTIMKGAKYYKKPVSRMYRAINIILKRLAFIIVPVGVTLAFIAIFFTGEGLNDAVNSSVAAMLGMLPQGLILLVSVVMAVSVVRLSKHGCLCRDMYCAETLARVDVLCLDKTGTLTTGNMQVDELIPVNPADLREADDALCALMHVLPDKNPTATAIRMNYNRDPLWNAESITPFSSARRYSGATFTGHGTYTISAASEAIDGKRTLTLSKDHKPIARLTLSDQVRPEARETLQYFARHGVAVKIISGDNPETVRMTAQTAGVENSEKFIDMSHIEANFGEKNECGKITVENLVEIVENYTIFGRVSPFMKLEIIKALKTNHTVGMVGDGVNDVLPLKEADFSAAMQSGSEAARNVSSLVLSDNNFASLPKAVTEGRRSINNLERSAALFLTKTIYSLVLAVVYLFIAAPFPLLPIQMTVVSGLFIGFPSFVLALEKSEQLVCGSFIRNVLTKAAPYGLCAAFGLLVLAVLSHLFGFTYEETRTAATISLGVTSFVILCDICRPVNRKRLMLIAMSGTMFVLSLLYLSELLFRM